MNTSTIAPVGSEKWARSLFYTNPSLTQDEFKELLGKHKLMPGVGYELARKKVLEHWGIDNFDDFPPLKRDGTLNSQGLVRYYISRFGEQHKDRDVVDFFAEDGIRIRDNIFLQVRLILRKKADRQGIVSETTVERRARFGFEPHAVTPRKRNADTTFYELVESKIDEILVAIMQRNINPPKEFLESLKHLRRLASRELL